MYKILLVTDRPEILDAFQAVSSWESLGFRVPRICNSAEGAIACLKAHHVDGIGIRLDMEQEALLMGHLTAFYPILPIFAEIVEIFAQKSPFKMRDDARH